MSAFRLPRLQRRLTTIATLAALGIGPSLLLGCHGASSGAPGSGTQRVTGQSDFTSAPQLGGSGSASFGDTGAAGGGTLAAAPTSSNGASSSSSSSSATRTVQETDLYAVEGNRLYYLNSYRGLMVFDITNPDAPALLGRSRDLRRPAGDDGLRTASASSSSATGTGTTAARRSTARSSAGSTRTESDEHQGRRRSAPRRLRAGHARRRQRALRGHRGLRLGVRLVQRVGGLLRRWGRSWRRCAGKRRGRRCELRLRHQPGPDCRDRVGELRERRRHAGRLPAVPRDGRRLQRHAERDHARDERQRAGQPRRTATPPARRACSTSTSATRAAPSSCAARSP